MTTAVLDHNANGYSLEHAYWLCKAANAAYKREPEIRTETGEWGFERFAFISAKHQMPFPLDDTQAYIVGSDRMIVVAFRGTEPLKIVDWLTDLNAPGCPGPAKKGMVHLGFHRALACIHQEILDKIQEFRTNDQTLWFTGHSLGGALAMLAAASTYFEDPKLLADGIYTFGQPRTCDQTLATTYDKALKSRTFRFVNNNDIVPQVPLEPVFQHIGTLKYFDAHGNLREQASLMDNVMDKLKGRLTTSLFEPGTDGIEDHYYWNYLKNIEKNLAKKA